ncbi:MAG: GAF domain-containing protein [Candidatus Eisenbacteria bacterium]|nr:GAF domain-containing protein [Candidatus Eisenbacteria bacterium]
MFLRLVRFLFGTLRGRLILGVAAVHAVMMALFIFDLTMRQRAMLLDRQVEEAAALAHALATSAAGWIAADDISGLQELVEAQHRYPELLYAMLTDDQGRVLADTDKSKLGLYMLDVPQATRPVVFSRAARLVDVAAPAMVRGRHVGWARVGVGQRAAGERLAHITRSGIAYALAAIVVGSVIAWMMGRRITRRLYAVQDTINRVRAGNRGARSSITGVDEAAVMAHEFNSMLDALAERDLDLRASEEKYRGLVRRIRAAILVHGADTRILMSNPLAQDLLGLTEEQLLGREATDPCWQFTREDGTTMPPGEFPVSRVLTSGQPLRDAVLGVRRPATGTDVWVLVSADPVRDERGAVEQVIVTFVDITDRRLAEEALRRLNRELRAISDCNQALMRAQDEQALLLEVCGIICDEAGYRMAWVGYAGLDPARTLRPVAWAGAEDGYLTGFKVSCAGGSEGGQGPAATAIRTGDVVYLQDFMVDAHLDPGREGALRRGYRSGIALPLKDSGGSVFGALVIYSAEPDAFTPHETRLLEELAGDLAFGIVTLRTRVEGARAEEERARLRQHLQQSQKMEAIGRLAGGVAHDFNNLLTVINGYSELALGQLAKGDSLQGDLQQIQAAGRRAAELTQQLLAFSRMQVVQPRVITLNDQVRDAEKMLKRVIGENIELVCSLDPALDTIRADPGQIHQILMNLVVNARDAMPSGGRVVLETRNEVVETVTAAHGWTLEPGRYAVLSVSDTGVGMSEEVMNRVFEPFFTTKEPGKGTGMGLATVFGIVQQAGGFISVSSRPDHGTAFTIYFLRVTEEGAEPTRPAAGETRARGDETILVVEDQQEVRGLMLANLRSLGYRVLEAQNGEDALRVCETHPGPIHLVITDVVMPRMSGPTMASRLVLMRPDSRVLFVSGYSENLELQGDSPQMCFDYLQKPFSLEGLARSVRELLDRSRAMT